MAITEITLKLSLDEAFEKALAPEKLQPVLDKVVNDAILSALHDSVSYNSDFQKSLKEQLAAALPHGLHVADVAKFQVMLNEIVSRAASDSNNAALAAAFKDCVDNVFSAPTEIKLSDLVKLARTDNYYVEEWESIYAAIEPTNDADGYYALKISREEPSSSLYRSSVDFELHVSVDGYVYSTYRSGRKDIEKESFPTAISEFDGVIINLYTGRCKLVRDIDDDEVRSIAAGSSED